MPLKVIFFIIIIIFRLKNCDFIWWEKQKHCWLHTEITSPETLLIKHYHLNMVRKIHAQNIVKTVPEIINYTNRNILLKMFNRVALQ